MSKRNLLADDQEQITNDLITLKNEYHSYKIIINNNVIRKCTKLDKVYNGHYTQVDIFKNSK